MFLLSYVYFSISTIKNECFLLYTLITCTNYRLASLLSKPGTPEWEYLSSQACCIGQEAICCYDHQGTGSSLGSTSTNGGTFSTENTTDKKVATLPPLVKDHWTVINTDLILVFQSFFCWIEQYHCYHSEILKALQREWQNFDH